MAGLVSLAWLNRIQKRERDESVADALLNGLINAETAEIPRIVSEMSNYHRFARPHLEATARNRSLPLKPRLHATLALLASDPDQADQLFTLALHAEPWQLPVISAALEPHADRIQERGWQLVRDHNVPVSQRLRVACILARTAPLDPRWPEIADDVVARLAAENLLFVSNWAESLRPVRHYLTAPLQRTFGNQAASQSARVLVAGILADYVGDNAEILAELIEFADHEQFLTLLPKARQLRTLVVPHMRETLARVPESAWHDELEPLRPAPYQNWELKFERAHGLFAEQFAWCQTMPLDEAIAVANELKQFGYRPSCFRPYTTPSGILVAAVWERDGRDWQLVYNTDARQILSQNDACRVQGYLPVDVSAYHAMPYSQDPPSLFSALWVIGLRDVTDARMYLNVPESLHADAWRPLNESSFVPHTNLLIPGAGDEKRYCSVRWRYTKDAEYEDCWEEELPTAESVPHERWCHTDIRLHGDPYKRDARLASTWLDLAGFETRTVRPMTPDDQVNRAQELIRERFRPLATSVVWDATSDRSLAASIWHRPVPSEAEKDAFTRRQANAAAMLLHLDRTDTVWQLLRHRDDPRLATWITQLLPEVELEHQILIQQLANETDASARQAILLALQGYAKSRASDFTDGSTISLLFEIYKTDGDGGVHSSARLLLDTLGQAAARQAADVELAVQDSAEGQNWRQTELADTMVRFTGPIEFQMGSTANEPFHQKYIERLHRRRIPRSFEIATTEVTVEQFLRFRPEHNYPHEYCPERSCPVIMINYFDAMAYCRWLSEQEGMPESEMCYPPLDEIREGMTLPNNYLGRRGYRLPTEAEMEYVCRADSITSRYYGNAGELLTKYAWTAANSNYQASRVAHLWPNRFGLFDVLGNAGEYCQSLVGPYPSVGRLALDLEERGGVVASTRVIWRGGAFLYQPSNARSAHRDDTTASREHPFLGFRVARTVP
jgi:formylglycine-generating enzyme required for sulfatase activity